MIAWILFGVAIISALGYRLCTSILWHLGNAYDVGYDAGYADALGEAMDASRVICRQAWMHSEWERN